jgi:branched-chain amino acid transport system substrate-binding protein
VRRLLGIALAAALGLTACGGEDKDPTVSGPTLTVYMSVPGNGVSAAGGRAAVAGARRALHDAHRRAAGRRVRLVVMSSNRPGDRVWDPGTVEANAERAGKDRTAIGYLGELDSGASAVSVPNTNRAGLLQVSPADGLTSLTRTPPGRPRAGPERYYPDGRRSFMRLVPSDLRVADALLEKAPVRRVAILHTAPFAERELAAVLAFRLRRSGRPPVTVEPVPDDPGAVRDLVSDVAAERPQVVLLSAVAGPGVARLLADLRRSLPGVPVYGSGGLAVPGPPLATPELTDAVTGVLPERAQPASGRRLLASLSRAGGRRVGPEALYGYQAMRVVLAAVDEAGPDRAAVIRAALRPGRRTGVLGPYTVRAGGEVSGLPLALLSFADGRPRFRALVP